MYKYGASKTTRIMMATVRHLRHILTSTRLLIRMHEEIPKTARESLPEDEHLVFRNMSKTT